MEKWIGWKNGWILTHIEVKNNKMLFNLRDRVIPLISINVKCLTFYNSVINFYICLIEFMRVSELL